jgi:uncharacterized SAM-binding protein YcdF (DUF218 family)
VRRALLIVSAALIAFGALLLTVFTAVRFTGALLVAGGIYLVALALLSGEGRAKRGFRRALLALFAVGLAVFAGLEVWVVSWARTEDAPVAAVVILGAGVNGREPSLSLKTRLDAALDYLEDQPEIPVVVSGGQGRGEEISEAECMAEYLTAHGVDRDRILLEDQSANTRENIANSKAVLLVAGVGGADKVAVVTSDYHLCRARYYWGSDTLSPVAAGMPSAYWPLTVNYFIREAFGMAYTVVFQ